MKPKQFKQVRVYEPLYTKLRKEAFKRGIPLQELVKEKLENSTDYHSEVMGDAMMDTIITNTPTDHTIKDGDIVSFKNFTGMRSDIAYKVKVKSNEIMSDLILVECKPL